MYTYIYIDIYIYICMYIYIDIPINMEPTLPSDNVKPGFPSPFLMGDDLRQWAGL